MALKKKRKSGINLLEKIYSIKDRNQGLIVGNA